MGARVRAPPQYQSNHFELEVQQDGMALRDVPMEHPGYGHLARIAVAQNGKALKYVPTDRADYGPIIRIAVAKNGMALRYVATDRADYDVIARLAVQQDGMALEYVTHDRIDFDELARIAVAQNGLVLARVPVDRLDFDVLARIAVAQNGMALRYVPTDGAEYGEIARIAVRQDAESIVFVPESRHDYSELAGIARVAGLAAQPPSIGVHPGQSGASRGPLVILAIDHDRCGRQLTAESVRLKGEANIAFGGLVEKLLGYGAERLIIVSYSNRQTPEIDAMLSAPTAVDHLQTISNLLEERLQNLNIEVDSRRHAYDAYTGFNTTIEVGQFELTDAKRTLAQNIVAAYPNASKFLFLDDKYEVLPVPNERIEVMQFSPTVWRSTEPFPRLS